MVALGIRVTAAPWATSLKSVPRYRQHRSRRHFGRVAFRQLENRVARGGRAGGDPGLVATTRSG